MVSSTNNLYYISVESRKGGVGKTTVSLSLAQTLLNKGFQVLLIDLDVSGTKLSDIFIREHESYLHAVAFQGKPLNIVELYKNVFLKGGSVPSYEMFDIDAKKCNYISSDIYCSVNGNSPIEDPRVFLDTLHSFWMKKLVSHLSDSFGDFVGKCGGQGVIILDNGPGFSSLETMIHEMFTTIGADNAKFLLVSSVDDQDWDAIEQLTRMIGKMMNEKIQGGGYYRALLNNDTTFKRIDSPYFEEIWKRLCMTEGAEPAYFKDRSITPEPSQYICRLVNKAPSEKKLFETVRKMGNDVVFVPFIPNIQYHFSSIAIIEDKDLPLENVTFSGDINSILEDNLKYEKCMAVLSAYESNFFKNYWAPLDAFRRLNDYYSKQEIPVKPVDTALYTAMNSEDVEKDSRETYEENLVRAFLHSMCEDRNIDIIVDEAVFLLGQTGDSSQLRLYTKKEALRHLAEPIMLTGVAIYYLKNYSSVCRLLSHLIASVKNPSVHRNLDLERLSSMVDNALVGQERMNSEFWDELKCVLTSQVNMRLMNEKLELVLGRWGI